VSLGASGRQRYDKVHLVPFGEFVPPGFAWFMAMANIPMSDFTAGSPRRRRCAWPASASGEHLLRGRLWRGDHRALPAATLLVNISNVAWFGDSLAPAQHLQIAQMRALETGRMMLRATNTGMTAIVDVDGRVLSVLPPFTRGALVGEVRGHTGAMPTFQEVILRLQEFWDKQGCALLQPYDIEVGAGTFHTATFLRAIGPEPWNAAYVQPSRRPKDGRYGENPNRLQHYYQYQVVLKPSPDEHPGTLPRLAACARDRYRPTRHPLSSRTTGKARRSAPGDSAGKSGWTAWR
jgi:hypothetical protein